MKDFPIRNTSIFLLAEEHKDSENAINHNYKDIN